MRKLPFGVPNSPKHVREIIRIIKYLKSFDVILIHHHICPFLAYYLSALFGSKTIWYCGEPLRALWENWLSSLDYREISCTVKPTSREFYGETITSLFLSNQLYDASVYALRTIDKASVRKYSKVVTNSNYTKMIVERIYQLKGVEVVYPGVEFNQELKTPKSNSSEMRDPYLLAVGSMIPMKNYFNLLKAFSHIEKAYPNIKLVIVGGGPLEGEIRSFTRTLNLKNVIFKSNVSELELSMYYANCLFTVHIALSEPFGLIPVEAAFYGKPSIVSNNGGTSEFIEDGKNGLLVNPYDPEDIAKAMSLLIEDKDMMFRAGMKAKEKALEGFTIERSAENLLKVIMRK